MKNPKDVDLLLQHLGLLKNLEHHLKHPLYIKIKREPEKHFSKNTYLII